MKKDIPMMGVKDPYSMKEQYSQDLDQEIYGTGTTKWCGFRIRSQVCGGRA